MKIAITGASGFIGAELIETLSAKEGVEITALTRGSKPTKASSVCSWINTDYSKESLRTALTGADVIIHLAGVRGTGSDPADYEINAVITENILKAIKETDVKRLVFASTISVYDDVDRIPWKEDCELKGRTAYGESKIKCEELIKRYAKEQGFSYAIARIAQVLGEGETRRGMMNVFIDTARAGGTLNVMGKSTAKRQYIFVKDLSRILSMLAIGSERCDACSDMVINVGMKEAYTNLEIAEIVNKVFGNIKPIAYDDSYNESIKSACMDTTRLNNSLGYMPLDMEASIRDFL